MYTGSYRRPGQVQRQVLRNESRGDIEEGMLVAVILDKYRERPLIGRVNEVFGRQAATGMDVWSLDYQLVDLQKTPRSKNGRVD